ncbi:MAG: ATP synthase F1 subunit delta [Actinomycetia bacterium]|nr:ATP synthase F1 subunit delta [Actinomycetes bacterium]MCP4960226.1 ATP synthase F1 subunit delta [Actinomycetes bacterium]
MSDKIDGYAAAVTAVASSEGILDTVADEFYQFARAMDGNDDLRETLTDRALPSGRRLRIVDNLLQSASPVTTSLVAMLVGAERGGDLPAIADRVTSMAAEARGQHLAEVRSAVPLTNDQIDRLSDALGRATGTQVDVKVVIDPSVLGGLIAQVGDTVIDGSVKTRLEKLKERV